MEELFYLSLNGNDSDDPPALIIGESSEQRLAEQHSEEVNSDCKTKISSASLKSVAVSIHAYYLDIFEEIIEHLACTSLWDCDLLIATSDAAKAKIIRQLLEQKRKQVQSKGAFQIEVVANRGRNILTLAKHGLQAKHTHSILLHLHTKKTADPQTIGNSWRRDLIEKLCGTDAQIRTALSLLNNESVGTLIPCRFKEITPNYNWDGNYQLSCELFRCISNQEIQAELSPESLLVFPAGMMFWFKPKALEGYFKTLLSKGDQLQEPLPYRGTVAHAAERLVCHACELNGFQWRLLANPSQRETLQKDDHAIPCQQNGSSAYSADTDRTKSLWAVRGKDINLSVLAKQPAIDSRPNSCKDNNTIDPSHHDEQSDSREKGTKAPQWLDGDKNSLKGLINDKECKPESNDSRNDNSRWLLRAMAYKLAMSLRQNDWEYTTKHDRLEQALFICRSLNHLRRSRRLSSASLSLISRNSSTLCKNARLALWLLLGDLNRWAYKRASIRINLWKNRQPHLIAAIASCVTQTYSYQRVAKDHPWSKIASSSRVNGGKTAIQSVVSNQPEKLLFWHHYDRLGYLPELWLAVLLEARCQGWKVVVSSSHLEAASEQHLKEYGIAYVKRKNIGLCLTAYKDFSLILNELPDYINSLQTVVFANDSVLPIKPAADIVAIYEEWHSANRGADRPFLRGMTDCVQLNTYHIQTYCFGINHIMLRHQCWYNFWLDFSPVGSKLDLIKNGELGLTQALLPTNAEIECCYSLTKLLLQAPMAANELKDVNISDIRCVNPSLFAWKSLLSLGYPFVKKQALFETCEGREPTKIALAELKQAVPECDMSTLSKDLLRLLQTRF